MKLAEIALEVERGAVGTSKALITAFANAKSTAPELDITLQAFIADIKAGQWKDRVEAVRAATAKGDTETRDRLKRQLPAVTISCTMSSRAANAALRARTHSGWLQCDFDAKENPALVQAEA